MTRFVKSPNLPSGKVSVAALGEAYEEKLGPALERYGVKLLRCPSNQKIDARLDSHIDLSALHIGENKFLLSNTASEGLFSAELKKLGADIIVSEKSLAPEYPNDAALCALSIGGRIFHNAELTAPEIKRFFPDRFFHVKQGYSKCAVCPVTENAAICSDLGLSKAMQGQGIDVLQIKAGFIALEGFNEGFIGGAAFKIARDRLAFTGTLDSHPDKAEMLDFLLRHGVSPVFLTDKTIFDVGSIIPILEE